MSSGPNAGGTYVVRRGDSLSKIAKDQYHNVHLWRHIAEANHIKRPYTIIVGQKLTLPKSFLGIYQVKAGDSIRRIAKNQYGNEALWPYLAEANSLRPPYSVFLDQPLILPPRKSQSSFTPARIIAEQSNLANQSTPARARNHEPLLDPDASHPAVPFIAPAFKFVVKEFELPPIVLPAVIVTCKLKGEMTIQNGKIDLGVTIDHQGQIELATSAEGVFKYIEASFKANYDSTTGRLTMSAGYAVKMNGVVYAEFTSGMNALGDVVLTYSGKELTGSAGTYRFKGQLSVELTLHARKSEPPTPSEATAPKRVPGLSSFSVGPQPVARNLNPVPTYAYRTIDIVKPPPGAITFTAALAALGITLMWVVRFAPAALAL